MSPAAIFADFKTLKFLSLPGPRTQGHTKGGAKRSSMAVVVVMAVSVTTMFKPRVTDKSDNTSVLRTMIKSLPNSTLHEQIQ